MRKDADTTLLFVSLNLKFDEMRAVRVGEVTENLCLSRILREKRFKICALVDTLSNGSNVSMLSVDAICVMAKPSYIAIQNGGCVRTDNAIGALTMADLYDLSLIAITLVEIDMTGAETEIVLEDALDYAP